MWLLVLHGPCGGANIHPVIWCIVFQYILISWLAMHRKGERATYYLVVCVYIYSMERERATYIDGHLFSFYHKYCHLIFAVL